MGQQLMASFREIPLLNPEIPFSLAQVIASLVLEVPKKASEMGPPKSLDLQQSIREGRDQYTSLTLLSPALEKIPKKQVTVTQEARIDFLSAVKSREGTLAQTA